MEKFLLNLNENYNISLFSPFHMILILITMLIVSIIILNRKKITSLSSTKKKIIRYSFGVLLIINMIIRRGSFIFYDVYSWERHLDINFCNFTSILFILYCFSGNKKILNIAYHMSFIGPLIAIFLPSSNLLPQTYSFYSFILLHNIVFIFSFIFMFIENIKWEKDLKYKFYKFLLIYYSIIFVFDYSFKVNYNLPLTFVNNSLLQVPVINFVCTNIYTSYMVYILIMVSLSSLGNQILKRLTKKD